MKLHHEFSLPQFIIVECEGHFFIETLAYCNDSVQWYYTCKKDHKFNTYEEAHNAMFCSDAVAYYVKMKDAMRKEHLELFASIYDLGRTKRNFERRLDESLEEALPWYKRLAYSINKK